MARYRTPIKKLEKLAPLARRVILRRGPITAAELAVDLRLEGNREAKRRIVRDVARYLRKKVGLRICANQAVGYWEARNPGEWAAYKNSRKVGAIFEFVEVRRMEEAAMDRLSRQRRLFPVPASVGW